MNKEGPPQFTTEWPTRGGIPHDRSSCGHHGHRRSVMELYYPLLTYFLIRLRTRLSSQKLPISVRPDLCAIGTANVGTSASRLHAVGNSCQIGRASCRERVCQTV